MKRLVFVLVLSACGSHIDNIGKQCQDTNVSCASDQDCPLGSTCGQNGLCALCNGTVDAALPLVDGPTCLGPTTVVACLNDADCVGYPGTTCELGPINTAMCLCPCTPPAQPVTCSSQSDCANYPDTTCLGNMCTCVVPSL